MCWNKAPQLAGFVSGTIMAAGILSLCLSVTAMANTPGSFMRVGSLIRNLSASDGKVLSLEPRYTPKSYKLIFDANGGSFPDGSGEAERTVVYNDGSKIYDAANINGDYSKGNDFYISLPEAPSFDKHTFLGWYLKGNNMPEEPGALDGVLIKNGSRYMIANDDEDDLEATVHTADGAVKALALWQENEFTVNDGNGPDVGFTGDDQEGDGEDTGDGPGSGGDDDEDGSGDDEGQGGYEPGSMSLWDEDHINNHVVEYKEGSESKTDYESRYGDIKHQYRRIVFNAETDFAFGYSWSVKRRDDEDFEPLTESGETYKADKLTREDDGSIYRCEVAMGENGEKLRLETRITVYWLPELGKTEVVFL